MLRIVYINTTGHFSGAAVSIVQVINALKVRVRPIVVTPGGSASRYFKKHVQEVYEVPWLSQFDHTRHGRYRGARWLVFIREVLLLPLTAMSLLRISSRLGKVDLIHLNEITGILGGVILKRALQVPLIVHVRANMGEQRSGWRSRFLWAMFKRDVDEVICIDETVRKSLPNTVKATVIHNALTLSPVAADHDGFFEHAIPRLDEKTIKVGIVGSLIRVKGVYEFVDAAIAICRKRNDISFVIVGSGLRNLRGVRGALLSMFRLAEDTEADLRSKIAASGFPGRILMIGYIEDVQSVYKHLDILCFPSHYDAPGRPIFEAAHFGVPSVVAISDPMPDTLIDGVTGLAIAAKDSGALQAAIERLADDPVLRRTMGQSAKRLANAQFEIQGNSARMFDVYRGTVKHVGDAHSPPHP